MLWYDDWKLVSNGFDRDELYDLRADPGELRNLAAEPAHRATHLELMRRIWDEMRRTADRTLLESQWFGLRFPAVGPATGG